MTHITYYKTGPQMAAEGTVGASTCQMYKERIMALGLIAYCCYGCLITLLQGW
jgi:hypothetical protein